LDKDLSAPLYIQEVSFPFFGEIILPENGYSQKSKHVEVTILYMLNGAVTW